jgi:hypothetical protein
MRDFGPANVSSGSIASDNADTAHRRHANLNGHTAHQGMPWNHGDGINDLTNSGRCWPRGGRGDATLRMPAQAIDIGGVLASRAEEFLKTNPNEERALRRLLTLRLAIVPPEGEPVRRQTMREECTEAEWSLAARLAEHPWRLVVMGEREVDKRVVAEVAHEALLRAWPRLADWLREERDFLVFKGDTERAQRRCGSTAMLRRANQTG